MPANKVIISGGGTGGHIFPAISIANALRELQPDIEILFVGAEGKIEMDKVPAAGYKIIGLPIRGLERKISLNNLKVLYRLGKSIIQARKIIKEFKPQAVIGVGGYASAAVMYVGGRQKIPCFIQEQNSYAGLTNKWLAKKALLIFTAYEGMERFFPKKNILLTGNPIRKQLLKNQIGKKTAIDSLGLSLERKTILCIGGSLGARTLNQSMEKELDAFCKADVQLIWQTGKYYYSQAQQAAQGKESHIKVFEFINQMDVAYAAADVIISRAGAGTISELCCVGKPCILVPSPNVAEDHQTQNALALASKQAAILITDLEATQKLGTRVLSLINNTNEQLTLSQNCKALAKPDADVHIAREILKFIS